MTAVRLAYDEDLRIAAVRGTTSFDTPRDGSFDNLAALPAKLFDAPISIVSIVDTDRISRGRTIRQFVTGVLLVPSLVSLVWFTVFGAAIQMQQGGMDLAGATSAEGQLFAMLGGLPIATVTSVLVMVLVAIFFVSGADAASIVMGSLSQGGASEPSRKTVVFWGVATGGVAAVMLLVGGDRTSPSSPRCRSRSSWWAWRSRWSRT